MTASAACADTSALHVATMLFHEVSTLTTSPSDGVYADYLLALAFNNLVSGLQSEPLNDSERLRAAAGAIEGCNWLSEAVRKHVSKALRLAAGGQMTPMAAAQIAIGARNRTGHQMVLDLMRAVASDGLSDIADALAASLPQGKAH